MYHEEKVIDGKLMFRTSPTGEWYGYTYEVLTKRLVAAETRARELERDAREAARDAATEARWQERQGEEYGSY